VVNSNKPSRLPTIFKEKVWGRTDLSPWYPDSSRKIGEVWFEADLPVLVKFVFTSERLSVQVHPDDAFAARHENSRGKTEMWHILKADPGAQIALGFRERITPERMREAAVSGEIEHLLRWFDVKAGDSFFTPAGTVHAIGAGLTICEIQQHSDITYRLYDYGRPRELHLDKALQVSLTGPADIAPRPFPISCEYFHTEQMCFDRPIVHTPKPNRFEILTVLAGRGVINDEPFQQGEAWLIPAASVSFSLAPGEPTRILRTFVPD